MNLIDQHIRKHLLYLLNEKDASFQEIFTLIQSKEKSDYILLLKYIHLLSNEVFLNDNAGTKKLHLHFEHDFNDNSLLIIAQYVLIRLFRENIEANMSNPQDNEKLNQLKISLQAKLKRLSPCPEGASGLNGGNRIYKNWRKDKKDIQSLSEFYNQLSDIDVSVKTLFNCQVRISNALSDLYKTKPYAVNFDEYNKLLTFNLLNTELTLNRIDEIDNYIIDNLETIVIFDCERKKIMQYFSAQDIIDYDIDLKKYLIISVGNKKTSIQGLREKINLIQDRFKISSNDSYPIIQSEIDYCSGIKSEQYIPVSFIGIGASHFWDAFLLETNVQDLYELRSIKMMNLYSLCFNEEIRSYILQELFSDKDRSDLISDETKLRLLDLRSDDRQTLKDLLSNLLDLIVNSGMKYNIINKIKKETVLLIDYIVINSEKLSRLISSALLLSKNNKLISWSSFKSLKNSAVLILSYQDQGKHPYYFYPNIIETTLSKSVLVEAIFHKFLFFNRYEWAKYNLAKGIYNLTNHPIRERYFHWNRLKHAINSLRPSKEDDINWNLEQQYSDHNDRETIKLKLKKERERTFNCSELFILATNDSNFRVEKIEDIISIVDNTVTCSVQNLDDIQRSINIYEKIVDTNQQIEELNIIRQQFDIDNESTGRLWKILLKKKALLLGKDGEDVLYDDLKKHLENRGLKIVSLHHFKSNWLNPESDSMAPISKKVFIELCHFLDLPKVYFVIIQRLRNVSKQSTRESTRQMNRLLRDLFNDGCFDVNSNVNEIISNKLENYKRNHPLDDLGIDEKYLVSNLITLVELIKPEINLQEIENIKRNEL